MIRRFPEYIDWFTGVVGTISSWLVLALVGAVCSEVAWRFIFGASLFWTYDATYTLYAAFFLIGASYALKHGAHIRSDFIYQSLPLKVRAAIDIFGYIVLFMPVLAVMFWYGLDATISAYQSNQRSMATRWAPPVWPLRAIIPATAALLFFQSISETIKVAKSFSPECKT